MQPIPFDISLLILIYFLFWNILLGFDLIVA